MYGINKTGEEKLTVQWKERMLQRTAFVSEVCGYMKLSCNFACEG